MMALEEASRRIGAIPPSDICVTVVHYDSDFETAATVLAFEHRWVLPRGTLDFDPPESR
jgi:hypothetical protein